MEPAEQARRSEQVLVGRAAFGREQPGERPLIAGLTPRIVSTEHGGGPVRWPTGSTGGPRLRRQPDPHGGTARLPMSVSARACALPRHASTLTQLAEAGGARSTPSTTAPPGARAAGHVSEALLTRASPDERSGGARHRRGPSGPSTTRLGAWRRAGLDADGRFGQAKRGHEPHPTQGCPGA